MRLFAALEVPDAVRGPLDAALAPLRDRYDTLAWTPRHQWHVTVAFLGSVAEQRLDEVSATLAPVAGAAAGPVELALADPGQFGGRVLWVGLDDRPVGAVASLGAGAQAALLAAGLPCDEKPVRPHLTLARPKVRRGRLPRGLIGEVPAVTGRWEVDDLVLFESVRGGHRQPNRYEVRARYPLGG